MNTHILIIDDDDIDARSIRRAFKKAGFSAPFLRAHDGEEALALLRGEDGHSAPPTRVMVLLDINMPRMDGLEFLGEVRADIRLRQLPIFVLTTSDDDRDINGAYNAHVAGYLVKQRIGAAFEHLPELIAPYMNFVTFPDIR
ncbi:MAG: response regulator [Myxococcota bacterium]